MRLWSCMIASIDEVEVLGTEENAEDSTRCHPSIMGEDVGGDTADVHNNGVMTVLRQLRFKIATALVQIPEVVIRFDERANAARS